MKVIIVGSMILIIVCFQICNAQAPNLGIVTGFALYTSNGAVTNTTTTILTGNIGTNLGAISGFDPPSVVNGIQYIQDDTTAQAALDLQTAYNQLLGTATTVPGHAAAFGTETILAGVYSIGGAGSVGGDLTLDAAGDSNAVFILKFGGALTVGAASNIILSNRALAGNVFWVVEGAISIAANVSMKGTLIAHTGANSLGTSSSLEGRMLSTGGAISVYFDTISKPTSGGYHPLPITLLDFTGLCTSENILLKWTTETEFENKYFILERREVLADWQAISTIKGAINSSVRLFYSYLDHLQKEGDYYYRLKQTDLDGKYTYSPIIFIKHCGAQANDKLIIFPNPGGSKFNLLYNGDRRDVLFTQVYNTLGEKFFEAKGFLSLVDFSNKMDGLYFIRLVKANEITIQKSLFKKR